MVSPTHSVFQVQDSDNEHIARDSAEKKLQSLPLLACILLLPSSSEPFLAILQKLINTTSPDSLKTTVIQNAAQALESQDSWLGHNAAAEYLGVSKSTLYRYAEQQRIESRKFGGRLEYRRSSLDKFKDEHVRLARRAHRGRGIIAPAPSSGK